MAGLHNGAETRKFPATITGRENFQGDSLQGRLEKYLVGGRRGQLFLLGRGEGRRRGGDHSLHSGGGGDVDANLGCGGGSVHSGLQLHVAIDGADDHCVCRVYEGRDSLLYRRDDWLVI